MPEWLNGAVSKTVERASVPRVRISLPPPFPLLSSANPKCSSKKEENLLPRVERLLGPLALVVPVEEGLIGPGIAVEGTVLAVVLERRVTRINLSDLGIGIVDAEQA